MIYRTMAEVPRLQQCRKCGQERAALDMVIRRRRDGSIYCRPRCKACHNAFERGRRREWKTAYLRRWRRKNPELARSYWRSKRDKPTEAAYARRWVRRHQLAYRVQFRMRRRGQHMDIDSCASLVREFGPAYPLANGLNRDGLRAVERWRSRLRAKRIACPRWKIIMKAYERQQYRLPASLQPLFMPGRRQAILARWATRRRAA